MTVFRRVQVPEAPQFDFLREQLDCGDLIINDGKTDVIDAGHLTLFPGLIDPHVHFRTPGQEYKEDWRTASRATLRGGYTTVFDMPNNQPACIDVERLKAKRALINQQLQEAGLPIHYELYLGADKNHLDQISEVRRDIIGVKVFMGSSTGDLLMDDDSSLHAVFSVAAHLQLTVGIHAEDESMIRARTAQYAGETSYSVHSIIRSPEVAAAAIRKVISLVKLYGTSVYILHVSSIEELTLIREAKAAGLPVYAETSPHHLFLNTTCYASLHGKAQMNPPLREPQHQPALFKAIHDGTIDTVGSDHAPHTQDEKSRPYGQCPSGVPGIETNLPLLLNAYHAGHLTLAEILKLTYTRIQTIFNYKSNNDFILIDLQKEKVVRDQDLRTKCGWSPYAGQRLKGWPTYGIVNQTVYDLEQL